MGGGDRGIHEGEIFSGHTTFNQKVSLIPTTVELPCCSFISFHTRLTDRYSNMILHNHRHLVACVTL